MSSAKKKKDSNQPELPIEGSPIPPAARQSKKPATNGQDHIVAEQVETIVHRPFDPKKIGSTTLVSVNDKLWMVGGYCKDKISKYIYEFDTDTEKWTRSQDMDIARVDHCSVVINFKKTENKTKKINEVKRFGSFFKKKN